MTLQEMKRQADRIKTDIAVCENQEKQLLGKLKDRGVVIAEVKTSETYLDMLEYLIDTEQVKLDKMVKEKDDKTKVAEGLIQKYREM